MSIQDAVCSLWDGLCTVLVQQVATDAHTGRSVPVEQVLLADLPCRLNHYYYLQPAQRGQRATAFQRCSLFVKAAVEIPVGSKIRVTQNGRTDDYAQAGIPVVFRYHREVPIALFERWV